MGKVLSVITQKGGVGKTSIAENTGIGLAKNGKKVLLVDFDPQATLTDCLYPEFLETEKISIFDVMEGEMDDEPISPEEVIIEGIEGVDLIPSSIELSGTEMELFNAMCRERVLGNFLNRVKDNYDYIIVDCGPSLGLLTINALAASDSVIIPMEPSFKSVKGMEQLMTSIMKIRKMINPDLKIDGIIFNKVNKRMNNHRKIMSEVREKYDSVFMTEIPASVKEAESAEKGKSIYAYDASGKVAAAYEELIDEFLSLELEIGR